MFQLTSMMNGDGLLENFYTLLWMKNEFVENKYDFKLPNTIIY
jgi:hypothetical protein